MTRIHQTNRAAAAAAFCIAAAAAPSATTVIRMTFSEVIRESTVIAVGRVETVESVWDRTADIPFTAVVLSDLELIAGEARDGRLALLFAGGTAPDGLTLEIAGMPRFSTGQRVVVFADPEDGVWCPLVGWWQGLYRVVYDRDRRADVVYNHAGTPVTGITRGAGGLITQFAAAGADESGREPMTLDLFTDYIRRAR